MPKLLVHAPDQSDIEQRMEARLKAKNTTCGWNPIPDMAWGCAEARRRISSRRQQEEGAGELPTPAPVGCQPSIEPGQLRLALPGAVYA